MSSVRRRRITSVAVLRSVTTRVSSLATQPNTLTRNCSLRMLTTAAAKARTAFEHITVCLCHTWWMPLAKFIHS